MQHQRLDSIATQPVVQVGEHAMLLDAARLMATHRVSCVPVTTAQGRLLGMVSELRLLAVLRGDMASDTPVLAALEPMLGVDGSMHCDEAWQLCLKQGVTHLAVLDDAQRLAGVVSETDFRMLMHLSMLAGRHLVPSVMQPVARTVPSHQTLREASAVMGLGGDAAAVVVDAAGTPVGVVTARDAARILAAQLGAQGVADAGDLPVATVMSRPVLHIATTATLNEAADSMLRHGVRHLAVLDAAGRLVGLLSGQDLARAMAVGLMDDAIAHDRVRQRAILDALPDLVWLKDPDGVYLACNPRFEQLFGAPEAQILGKTDHDFVPAELADFFREKDRAAMARNAPTVNEELLRFASDGHAELTQTIKTPVRDAQGRLLGVLGIGRDITALRRAEDQFRLLFERSPAPMLVVDSASQRLLAVNDAFCQLYGWTAEQAQGLTLADLQLPAAEPGTATAPDAAAVAAQPAAVHSSTECRHRRRDGSVMQVLVQSHEVERDGRPCRVDVVTDITRQHRSRQREHSRLQLLDSLIRGDALPQQLQQLALDHEAAFPGSLCSILLLDEAGLHMQHGAAPSLPDFYNDAIHGLAIGPDVGACGAAAYSGQRVVCEDLSTDPRWTRFLPLAQRAGLGACWSTPVLGAGGQVLGTFAVYRRHPARPADDELDHATFAAGLAALAVGQQRNAQRLRDSERRLADTLEALPDPIWLTDRDGALLLANAAYRHLVADGQAHNRATLGLHDAAVLHSGVTGTAEHRLELPGQAGADSSARTDALFEVVATPMRDAQGHTTGVLGAARDITLLRRSAQELADQLRLVDTMFSQTTDAIVLMDPQTLRFITFNEAACRGLGYSRDEFTRLRPGDLQAELDETEVRARNARAMAGDTQRFDTVHRHRDGHLQQVAITLRRLEYGGRPLLSVVWQDVTESRRHVASIGRLNQAYAVLSGVNEAIVRLQDGAALLAEVCRIAVQVGGFRHAWIGRRDTAAGAQADGGALLTEAGNGGQLHDLPAWSGAAAAALQSGTPQVLHAPADGRHSLAAFPISPAGRPRSVLVLQADDTGHFDRDELALYTRLVRDVGHAIETIAADQELALHRQHLEQLVAQRTQELEQLNRRLAREDLRLRTMLDLSRRAAGLDEAALWQHGIDALVSLVGAHCGSLHPVDAATGQPGVAVWSCDTPNGAREGGAATVAALCAQALQTQAPVSMPLQVAGAQHLVTAVPVQDGEHCVMVVCVAHALNGAPPDAAHDLALAGADLWAIVQRRRTEIALVQAKAAADAASQAKSAFLANMSHEIRTPLNAVLGFAHLLQREPLSARQVDHLGKIADASQHLLQVINDILDFSKIEASKVQLDPTDFALQPSLQRLLAMVADKARANQVRLDLRLDAASPAVVHGDCLRLEQILLNLLSNAVKFTPGGRVELQVAPLRAGWLRFDVVDTGIGIDEAQLPQLFKPFEQADASTTRRFGGTGLGLAICHRLALLMGGRVGVASRLGQGSRFWLELPLPAAAGTATAAPAPPPTAPATQSGGRLLQGLQVLLAEDNPINQEVALELLSAQGAQVDVADDGQAALDRARERTYDLVLMDVQMPRMDGLRAAQAIRQLPDWARVPIVAMTASAFPEDRAGCLAAGMDDVLVKPVQPDALTQCLLRWSAPATGDRAATGGDAARAAAAPLPAMGQAPSDADRRASLVALRKLLQSHDTEAADHLARHADTLATALGRQYADLATDVKGYAFEAALARVDALLAGLAPPPRR